MKKKILIKTLFIAIFGITAASLGLPAVSTGDDSEARDIMAMVNARNDGDNETADLEMILIDHKGNERMHKISFFRKNKDADKMLLMLFLEPAAVKDTAFLSYDYADPQKEDDQWLFQPALEKTERIATSKKSRSFMGSDLSYSDLTLGKLSDYNYSFYEKGREREYDGVKTWAIWVRPRSKKAVKATGYEKSLVFVRQDNYVISRSVSWMENGGPLKYMIVKKLEKIDDIWVATEIELTQKFGERITHQTLLRFSNIKFNQNLDENIFSVDRMENGF